MTETARTPHRLALRYGFPIGTVKWSAYRPVAEAMEVAVVAVRAKEVAVAGATSEVNSCPIRGRLRNAIQIRQIQVILDSANLYNLGSVGGTAFFGIGNFAYGQYAYPPRVRRPPGRRPL